jgi:hypothetical protein
VPLHWRWYWRSLTPAARRAIASRRRNRKTGLLVSLWCHPGLPQEWFSDSERGLSCEAVSFRAALRVGGLLCSGQWKIKVLKIPGQGSAEIHLLTTREARFLHPREHVPLEEAALRYACYMHHPEKCAAYHVVLQICACALHEFRGGTVCGVGAEGFASFPCQTDRGLEE